MKLWEKNYVLAMGLIMLILYVSMFFVLRASFKMNFDNVCNIAIRNEQSIAYLVQSFLNEDTEYTKLKIYCQGMQRQGCLFSIYRGDTWIVGELPFQIPSGSENIQMLREGNVRYLFINNSFSGQDGNKYTLYYTEDMGELYDNHTKQLILLVGFACILSLILAAVLYFSMKKIYYPIDNIAHELRTPLTSIQGYAQYILYGKIKEEDIQYAGNRINEEAIYMNNIIERLLVMENVRDGKIVMERVELKSLFDVVEVHYPDVVIDNQMDYVLGDRTLLLSLLLNLLSNTGREGSNIHISAAEHKIIIYNPEDAMDENMTKILNGNRKIPREKVKGKGFGVHLCHEIVKLHHGQLRYEVVEGGGMRVTVYLP